MIYKNIAFMLIFILSQEIFASTEEKVIVYNWPDYIPENVLDNFTKETGIKVEYSTYKNNHVMYTRLKLLNGRGYDVVVPSTDLVGKMRAEGLIQPLHYEWLENIQKLDPLLMNKSYDPENKFSLPYLWGSTGIVVDTEKFDSEKITSWADLWQRQLPDELVIIDDFREVFHAALKLNKYSNNTTDSDEIRQSYTDLKKIMPRIKGITSDPLEGLESGEIQLGITWNGDVAIAQKNRPSLKYIYPEEGASFWIDSFVIPSRSSNVKNAHKFIDYMLRPDVAALCVEELGYATPVLEAKKMLSQEIVNNPIIFPPEEIMEKAEFQVNLDFETLKLYRILWDKLKGTRSK